MLVRATIIYLILFNFSHASEVDNFTGRYEQNISDSLDKINLSANIAIERAIESSNQKSNGCDENELYVQLRKKFNNHYRGQFTRFVYNSNEIERLTTPVSKSIYQDFTPVESIVLGAVGKYVRDPLGSIIKIDGNLIGTDKFEHFAGTGFIYFKHFYLKHESIEKTLAIGQRDENGYLGAISTGIISYGDMTAEFNGMRFWNHVLNKNQDILKNNLGPYVKCENDRWIKSKEIDLSQYVDPAWDEAYNCSKFRTNAMVDKVRNRLKKLSQDSGMNYNCPIDPKIITQTKLKYGQFSSFIINSNGHQRK